MINFVIFQNTGMESSNAFQGCGYCYVTGKSETTYAEIKVDGEKKIVPKGSVTVFPFQRQLQLRTHEEVLAAPSVLRNLQQEDKSIKSYKGIKEPSLMAKIMPDIVNGMAIDLMHLLEGIVKRLLELWTSSTHHKKDFSIRGEIAAINEKLEKIRPPSFIARFPRTLDEVNNWKASEFKNFLLYYGLPTLLGLLPVELLDNFAELVYGIYTLSQCSITKKEFEESEKALDHFLEEFQKLYGLRYMTMNFHLLQHFASSVKQIGASWVSSCFIFENYNGKILNLIHGTRFADNQLASNLLLMAQFPISVAELPEGKVKDFCNNCSENFHKLNLNENICKGIFSVGNYKVIEKPNVSMQNVLTSLKKPKPCKLKAFHRLKKGKFLFASQHYCKDLQFENSYVSYKDNNSICFGIVQQFVKICNSSCSSANCKCPGEFFTFVEKCAVDSFNKSSSSLKKIQHIKKFQRSNCFALIKIENLESVVIKISENYLAVPLNTVEKE